MALEDTSSGPARKQFGNIARPRVIGGRYGLGSKEFTPAMVKAIFEEAAKARPRNHFTIGIDDDVTHTSLPFDPSFSIEDSGTVRALFFGLGSDGTVSANKNSIKIIGEETDNYAQAYFVYDSKKSGSRTISHLRFGPRPIAAPYLIARANFIACHQFSLLEQIDVLVSAEPGAVFLLNAALGADEIWAHLPLTIQRKIISSKLRFYVIDGTRVAREAGLGNRINTILQTAFFAIGGVLPRQEAINAVKLSIEHTYRKHGEAIVKKNFAAVDRALDHLYEVKVPDQADSSFDLRPPVTTSAPAFVGKVIAPIVSGEGDRLPVSALPADGVYPSGTARYEKRNLAAEIPVWDTGLCIQCGKCVLVCPHSAIRAKVYSPDLLQRAPATFKSAPARWREFKDSLYTLQVAPEDCTGCTLCYEVCPAKSKTDTTYRAVNMRPQLQLRDAERENWDFFLDLPVPGTEDNGTPTRDELSFMVKDVQLLEPMFEFSGACSGCGETPYLKLLTQLFGDRLIIANATGCSSIYGANLPTTPWSINAQGFGPAWCNSLFEDNAEFGMGLKLATERQTESARQLLVHCTPIVGADLAHEILDADQFTEAGILAQRERVARLKVLLKTVETIGAEMRFEGLMPEFDPRAADLLSVADFLVKRSVWIIGGDGWAYDIGYGGLDHVLASGADVKVLVLDTEVYSNTGGQASKATPRGAVARFAAGGKPGAKKDLAALAMTYGNIYVAQVAMGGSDTQTVKALIEAEAYPGPALVISYGHCIAHGYDLSHGLEQQKAAVFSGYWPLFRYNPTRLQEGKNPLQLDSRKPTLPLEDYFYREQRFASSRDRDPVTAGRLLEQSRSAVERRWRMYEYLAAMPVAPIPSTAASMSAGAQTTQAPSGEGNRN